MKKKLTFVGKGWPYAGEYKGKKIRAIILNDKQPREVILNPSRLSPDGEWLEVGGCFHDQLTGWNKIKNLEILTVLQVFDEIDVEGQCSKPIEKDEPWYRKMFCLFPRSL